MLGAMTVGSRRKQDEPGSVHAKVALALSALATLMAAIALFRSSAAQPAAPTSTSSAAPSGAAVPRPADDGFAERLSALEIAMRSRSATTASAAGLGASASPSVPPPESSAGSASSPPSARVTGFVRFEGVPSDVTLTDAGNGVVIAFSTTKSQVGKTIRVKGVRVDGSSEEIPVRIEAAGP